MLSFIRPAFVLLALLSALTGLAYPLAITGMARIALRWSADGSLVTREGAVVGSSLIGQTFASAKYFQGRPSATQGPDPKDASKTVDAPNNAASSTGSNLGPTSQKLMDRVKDATKGAKGLVPADSVTTSASGLDPHISPENALSQVEAVAAARGAPADKVRALVESHVEGRVFGLIGEPRINVLALNLALDGEFASGAGK